MGIAAMIMLLFNHCLPGLKVVLPKYIPKRGQLQEAVLDRYFVMTDDMTCFWHLQIKFTGKAGTYDV